MAKLVFDPSDPFPLFVEGAFSYADECLHAMQVDAWLGLRTADTERLISSQAHYRQEAKRDGQNFWIDLSVASLQTPYTEIRRILNAAVPIEPSNARSDVNLRRVIDLGAGYGRLGFVLGREYPDVEYIGYEYVTERLTEGARCLRRGRFRTTNSAHASDSAASLNIIEADLQSIDFQTPVATHYFIYDFGSARAISKILNQLREISLRQKITVIGRGRASRDLIEQEHFWLSKVVEPQHFKNFSIYQSAAV